MSEYIVRMPSDMPYEIKAELNAWYVMDGPIVRCRDCAYMFDWSYDRPLCKLWAFNDPDENESSNGNALYPRVKLDGYCAWGERRSE